MQDRIKLKVKDNREENISFKTKEIAQALEDLCAETTSSKEARKLTRGAFRNLGYEIRFSQPKQAHFPLPLKTTKAIRGKENVGEIYILGNPNEKRKQELIYLANIAGKEIDHVERGEEWRKETEFHKDMNKLVAHDLCSPINIYEIYGDLIKENLDKVIDIKDKTKLNNWAFNMREHLKIISSANRRTLNMGMLLNLDNIGPEKLIKEAHKINPLETLIENIESTTHDAIKREKGLKLYYREKEKCKNVKIHKGAFTTITTNLIDNAINYSAKNTTIETLAYFNKNNLILEINNALMKPIRIKELKNLLKKGYRSSQEDEESIFSRNQGFGLYFVNKIIKDGFEGDLEVESDYKNRLGKERTHNLEEINFTKNEYPSSKQHAKFYTKISIPLIE